MFGFCVGFDKDGCIVVVVCEVMLMVMYGLENVNFCIMLMIVVFDYF